MTVRQRGVVLWSPRILGIGVALLAGIFALDAWAEGVVAFLLHLTPTLLLLSVVAVSWRHEWFGATVFLALALTYAAAAPDRPDWILVVSGPLLVVGALFFGSWQLRARRIGG